MAFTVFPAISARSNCAIMVCIACTELLPVHTADEGDADYNNSDRYLYFLLRIVLPDVPILSKRNEYAQKYVYFAI
jgi:hypothetical protein